MSRSRKGVTRDGVTRDGVKRSGVTRRRFVQGTAAAAGTAAGATALGVPRTAAAARRILGSNDDVRCAVVGLRGQGKSHMKGLHALKGVRVVALCDVDRNVLDQAADRFDKIGDPVRQYRDVRELLEDDTIDAVSIATPNHWHSLIGIWACQAGKDVYVEKPVSHYVHEGRVLVRAARRYGRIVQTGTQSRSNPGLMEALRFVRDGGLGDIELARGLCYKPRPSIGKVAKPTPIPDFVDYDLWCGPAPKRPLMRENLHYDWHWVWDTGDGDLGNQGIHQMDMARIALGEPKLARSVFSVGGRVGYVDDGETPNTMITVLDYERAPLVFETRGLPREKGAGREMDRFSGVGIGVVVHCADGHLSITSYHGGTAFDRDGAVVKKFDQRGDHFQNFIDAVQSRSAETLNGPIEDGHVSSALCHLGNVSYLRGAEAPPGEMVERMRGDAAAMEAYGRMHEHLGRNGVDLGETPLVLGASLRFDPERESFVDDERANELARGSYRAPFVLPERV